MGYRYSAYVTFPLAAKETIKDVAAWLSENVWAEVYEEGAICQVSDVDASYGEINITKVLDVHRVPYDHHHRDDSAMEEYTIHVRYLNGERREYRRTTIEEELKLFAREILSRLDSGDVSKAKEVCQQAQGPDFVGIDDLSGTWASEKQPAKA